MFKDCTGNRLIRAVAQTLECHVTTPLNDRDTSANNLIGFDDLPDFTMGTPSTSATRRRWASPIALPVTGPRPFCGEFLFQFNLRY